MTYKRRSLLLVLEVITIGTQHLLPSRLQLFNPLAVKLGAVGRKEVRESLAHVCFTGEGFTTRKIVQGMEEVLMEQGQVSKEDVTKSHNQVAVSYSWPLARHASSPYHAITVHPFD
ncbi:hypothetical protein TNCV_2595971 [Trichonephila clavipes]|nr:hypothetical protein TNCV_2595971 [Trichonephila clavipes]